MIKNAIFKKYIFFKKHNKRGYKHNSELLSHLLDLEKNFFGGGLSHTGSVQELLLQALHSEITPEMLGGPCGMLEIKPRLAACKAKTLSTVQLF